MLAENKKTRVPGKPRHFIDIYLDELDKVCESFLFMKMIMFNAVANWHVVDISDIILSC